MKADKSELEALLPALGQQAEVASKRCRDEIRNPAGAPWPDDQLLTDQDSPPAELSDRVAEAGGVLAERFAICPPLVWNRFEELAAELNKAGYRPTRVRPTYVDEALCVSAVWKPDGAVWKVELSLTSEELQRRDVSMREQGFLPEDLAVHAENGTATGARTRYACLWVKSPHTDAEARLALDQDVEQLMVDQAEPANEGSYAEALDVVESADGAAEQFAVLWKKNTDPHVPKGGNVLEFGTRYARLEAVPWDVALRSSGQSLTDEQAESTLSVLEPGDWKVSTWVDNPRPLLYDRQISHGGRWSARLSASSENDVVLQQSVRVDPAATYLFSGWVRTRDVHIAQENGTLGANLSVFSPGRSSQSVEDSSDWTYVNVVFAAGGQSQVLVCARLGSTDSVCVGTAWFDNLCLIALSEEESAEGLWKDPQFLTSERRARNLLRNPGFESPPAAVAWRWLPHWESEVMDAVEPARFQTRAAELARAGFRPISIVTNRAATRARLRIYAVWARYVGDPAWQDAAALQRANAAVILASLAELGEVMRLFRDDEHPSARSYLIERLHLAHPNLDQLIKLLASQDEPAVRYGFLLSLGPLLESVDSAQVLEQLRSLLVAWQSPDEDPGVRARQSGCRGRAPRFPRPHRRCRGRKSRVTRSGRAARIVSKRRKVMCWSLFPRPLVSFSWEPSPRRTRCATKRCIAVASGDHSPSPPRKSPCSSTAGSSRMWHAGESTYVMTPSTVRPPTARRTG